LLSTSFVAAVDGPIHQVMKLFWFSSGALAGFTANIVYPHLPKSAQSLFVVPSSPRRPLAYDLSHCPPSQSQSHNSQTVKFDGM
jgi:hypothetical protein